MKSVATLLIVFLAVLFVGSPNTAVVDAHNVRAAVEPREIDARKQELEARTMEARVDELAAEIQVRLDEINAIQSRAEEDGIEGRFGGCWGDNSKCGTGEYCAALLFGQCKRGNGPH